MESRSGSRSGSGSGSPGREIGLQIIREANYWSPILRDLTVYNAAQRVQACADAPDTSRERATIIHAGALLAVAGLAQPDEGWQPIDTAPTTGVPVLLFTTNHGQVEGWFAPGEWQEYHEGREYNGPAWVCADDAFQIEVEETPEGLLHGEATHWRPRPDPPFDTTFAEPEAEPEAETEAKPSDV